MLILLLEESISITGTAAITSLSDVISAAGTETITGTAAVTTTADVAAAAGTDRGDHVPSPVATPPMGPDREGSP